MTLPVAHLPTFVWLADPYPSIRRASVDEVIRAMDLAAELGVSKAVLHPGYLTGMMRAASDLGRRYADESLVLLLEAARERNIVLCLENMFPRAGHMYRPEEFGQTLADHPDLMMTLDVAHALIGGPASRLTGLIEAGGRRIRHVHVSDHGGQEDDHLPLGAGRVPVQDALKRMKNLGYDDTITLEVFSSDRDLLFWSLRKVREWWEAL
jgi:sugar phosphate isomerase/epimerase